MRYESDLMVVPVAAGAAGAARVAGELVEKYVSVAGYVDGGWKVQASDDGVAWLDAGVTFSGNGWYAVGVTARYVRLWCVVLSTSAPSVALSGRHARTE